MMESEIVAINRDEGKVALDDGTILDIAGWHNSDEGECDPDEATFVTFQLPDGSWTYAMLDWFGGTRH